MNILALIVTAITAVFPFGYRWSDNYIQDDREE